MSTPEKSTPERISGLSICIPVYNNAAQLDRLLTAIQRQNTPGLEVVAVNNASTDDSLKILEAWQGRLNLKIFSTPCTISLPDNWLLTLSLGTREFLKLQLAEDMIPDGAVNALLAAIQQDERLGFVFGNTEPIDAQGALIRSGPPAKYWARVNAMRRQMPAARLLKDKARCLAQAGIRLNPMGDANAIIFRASLLPHLRHGVNKLASAFQTWPEYEIFLRLFAAAEAGYLDIPASHYFHDEEKSIVHARSLRLRRRAYDIGSANILVLLMMDPDLKPLTAELGKFYFLKHILLQLGRAGRVAFKKE